MIPTTDHQDREIVWDADLVSDMVLSIRPYEPADIGDAIAFWRR